MGRSGTGGAANLDFTDGDTLKRFTVNDADVTVGATITPAIQRPNIQDVDDPGWIYTVNVVTVANGSFDVLVSARSAEGDAGPNEFPNELVRVTYLID